MGMYVPQELRRAVCSPQCVGVKRRGAKRNVCAVKRKCQPWPDARMTGGADLRVSTCACRSSLRDLYG
jgi:hypothetical protein